MLVYRSVCEEEAELLSKGIITGSPTPINEGLGYSNVNTYDKNKSYKYFFLFAEDAFAYRNIYERHKYVVQYDIPIEILKAYLDFGNYNIVNLNLVNEETEDEYERNFDYEDFFTGKYDGNLVYSILPEFKLPLEVLDNSYIKDICKEDKMPAAWRNSEYHNEYLYFLLNNSWYFTMKEQLKFNKILNKDIINKTLEIIDNINKTACK